MWRKHPEVKKSLMARWHSKLNHFSLIIDSRKTATDSFCFNMYNKWTFFPSGRLSYFHRHLVSKLEIFVSSWATLMSPSIQNIPCTSKTIKNLSYCLEWGLKCNGFPWTPSSISAPWFQGRHTHFAFCCIQDKCHKSNIHLVYKEKIIQNVCMGYPECTLIGDLSYILLSWSMEYIVPALARPD